MKYRDRFKFRYTVLNRSTTEWVYSPWLLWATNLLPWRVKEVITYHMINETCLYVPGCIGAFEKLTAQDVLGHYKAIHDPTLDANCKDFTPSRPSIVQGSPSTYLAGRYCRHCRMESHQHENPKINELGRLVRGRARNSSTWDKGLCSKFVPQRKGTYVTSSSCTTCGWGENAHQPWDGISEENDPWLQ